MLGVSYLSHEIPGGLKTVKYLEINDLRETHINHLSESFNDRHFTIMKQFLPTFEGPEQLTITLPDETGDLRQLLLSNQAFKNVVNQITGGGIAPGRNWAQYLGFKKSGPKNITFRPFRPVTVYSYCNKHLDIWSSME
jgi:hypothetical protein